MDYFCGLTHGAEFIFGHDAVVQGGRLGVRGRPCGNAALQEQDGTSGQ